MAGRHVHRSTPVFVDGTGRRNRVVQIVVWLLTVSVLGYLALVTLSLFLPPGLGALHLPGVPGTGAAPLAPAAKDVLAGRAAPVPPSPRPRPTASPTPSPTPAPTASTGVITTPTAIATPRRAPTPTRPVPGVGNRPTTAPTAVPTSLPVPTPTASPTTRPTGRPTTVPTGKPTVKPTHTPPGQGRKPA